MRAAASSRRTCTRIRLAKTFYACLLQNIGASQQVSRIRRARWRSRVMSFLMPPEPLRILQTSTEPGWVNNSWARTTDELTGTLEDWPTKYPNSQLGRSQRSIGHGGQSGFNSCIEATKTYLTGNLKSLLPSTFTNVSFVARSSPRNKRWRQCGPSSRFERLGGCGFGTWTHDRVFNRN